ncbi:MAG TPA: nucleotidyltransferase domain-containing protein [Planctomycetota bacterium]
MTGPHGELPILPAGTQVVTTVDLRGDAGGVRVPRGAVGTIVKAPSDGTHSYRVELVDGGEVALLRDQLATLARWQDSAFAVPQLGGSSLFERVILRVVVGSRAYGLDEPGSDTDRRGVFLPPAELHWSLFGVPEQIDDEPEQEIFWELQKLIVMALKANPNVLECLWSPLVEVATPLGRELLALRESFLSQLVFQTYSGYVASQFKKIAADLRQRGEPKWKHVMHLLRLLQAGIQVLRTGSVPVHVGAERERLLAVRRGEIAWSDVERWRRDLHAQFTAAAGETKLPVRPDYERADAFLRRARRLALGKELP